MTDAVRGLLVGGVVGLATSLIVADAYECSRPEFGCVPLVLGAIAAALAVALLLGWLLLFALRVRSSLMLAITGTLTTLLAVVAVGGESPGEPASMAGIAAAGYGVSAFVFSARSPVPLQLTAGVLLVAGVAVLLYQL